MERKVTFFARGFVMISVVLFVVLFRLPMVVNAADVALVKGDSVSYMGYSTHYYYVDGNLAFCLEPSMRSPGNGVYSAEEVDSSSLLGKAMYYVYGGPGYEEYMKPTLTGGWDRDDRAYCLSHCILSYIYDGCNQESDAFRGLNADIQSAVVMYADVIQDWPNIPKADISLSGNDFTAAFDEEEGVQRTERIICTGDGANSIILPLPEGVTLVNETRGSRESGNVRVYGGDQFYLCADVAYNNGGIWESGELRGEVANSWRTLVVTTGEGNQDIGSAAMKTVETAPISVKVAWLEKPELQVEKSADKSGKTYRPGDVITYTVDVTQQIQNAVAKNVTISDTILTEGVKLQKNSIVLLDENQNRLTNVPIQVSGNTYQIQAGQFLKGIETGQKYTVEYQVAITDESVIGKEIENEVVVRAENAEDKKDNEKVKVEEPEKPEENEAEKPEQPEEPEQPKRPEIKQVQPKPQIITKPASVKTGDATNAAWIVIFMIVSGMVILLCRLFHKTQQRA